MIKSQYLIIIRPRFIAASAVCLGLAACDEPTAPPAPAAVEAPAQTAFSIAGRSWIDVDDKMSPALWLASREAGRDLPADDPAVASFRALLHEADIRFSEASRMVANRAVQVQGMLAERGVKETPREVIEGLVSIGEIGERAGFGETCQHYVNARVTSPDRAAALAALKRRPLPAAAPGDEVK